MRYILVILLALMLFAQCVTKSKKESKGEKLKVVTTTTMITDLVEEIGGDKVIVEGLMGAGVDPHLYKASEGDVNKLFKADMVIYSGLHLEGKLEEVFEKMKHRGIHIVAASDGVTRDRLISSENFASSYDPHIWFDLQIWKDVSNYVAEQLIKEDTLNSTTYKTNLERYLFELDSTLQVILSKLDELPVDQRVLITAHDAFNYFGRAYQFNVWGLQGISTASEAGVKDVQKLADAIVEKKVKAVFIESSVPRRNIEALQEAVKARGFEVKIGGELYSDALGNPGTVEGTYTGMFVYNVNTIVNALKE